MTLTVTYNPNVLRVRTVQDGMFLRQGGATVSFTPKIDNATACCSRSALSGFCNHCQSSHAPTPCASINTIVMPGTKYRSNCSRERPASTR